MKTEMSVINPREPQKAEQQAAAWGIDVTQIEANLQRTPTERIEVHQRALDTISELRRAGIHAGYQDHSPETSGKRS